MGLPGRSVHCFLAVLGIVFCVAPGHARATLINGGFPAFSDDWFFDFNVYPSFIGAASGSAGFYDSTTGIFRTENSDWAGPLYKGNPLATYSLFDANLSVNAVIDPETGVLLDGVVTWVGSIPEVGIGSNSLLMFGDVIAISLLEPFAYFQFVLEPRFTNPLWGLDLGPRMWLLMASGDIACEELGENGEIIPLPRERAWTCDHNISPFEEDDLYFGIPVPEPVPLALSLIGMLGVAFVRRRKAAGSS